MHSTKLLNAQPHYFEIIRNFQDFVTDICYYQWHRTIDNND